MHVKTFSEIYTEFCMTGIDINLVEDWRPCMEPYYDISIPGAILIYLKEGKKLIYIPQSNYKSED